jgi:tetratricopeptide (TPR) repeat protein
MGEETRIATETLAELYLKAQNIEKAYEIYQQLLSQNPSSIRYREKVRELELRLRESGGIASGGNELPISPQGDIQRSIGELKGWLKRIQRAKKKST